LFKCLLRYLDIDSRSLKGTYDVGDHLILERQVGRKVGWEMLVLHRPVEEMFHASEPGVDRGHGLLLHVFGLRLKRTLNRDGQDKFILPQTRSRTELYCRGALTSEDKRLRFASRLSPEINYLHLWLDGCCSCMCRRETRDARREARGT
jgi:hypothetical protein